VFVITEFVITEFVITEFDCISCFPVVSLIALVLFIGMKMTYSSMPRIKYNSFFVVFKFNFLDLYRAGVIGREEGSMSSRRSHIYVPKNLSDVGSTS
jgi:hypothetical protein